MLSLETDTLTRPREEASRLLSRQPEETAPAPTSATAQVLIETHDLTKRYSGASLVLDRLALTIRDGETVALIGSNGTGKSTLLKVLVGLREFDDGAISIFGERFSRKATGSQQQTIRRGIGFVFQQHGLVRRHSALTNVVQGMMGSAGGWRAIHQATAPREWRDSALEALRRVGLEDKVMSRADELSGGQSQRVAIARALVRKPRLFIADEPAASLDPATGREVMQTFADIAADRGTTLLFTTHDMEHALNYANRVIALKKGRIFLDAACRDLGMADLEGVFRG